MKKLASVILALVLLLGAYPIGAYASETTQDGDTLYSEGYFLYTVRDKSVTITDYFGKETVVDVPNQIAGYPVNAIAADAFKGTGVEEINLPDTIVYLGDGATADAVVQFAGTELDTSVNASEGESGEGAAQEQGNAAPGGEGETDSETSAENPAAGAQGERTPAAAENAEEAFDDDSFFENAAKNAENAEAAENGEDAENGGDAESAEADAHDHEAEAAVTEKAPSLERAAQVPDTSVKLKEGETLSSAADSSAGGAASAGGVAAGVVVVAAAAAGVVVWRKKKSGEGEKK